MMKKHFPWKPQTAYIFTLMILIAFLAAGNLITSCAYQANNPEIIETPVIWIGTQTPLPLDYYQQDKHTNEIILGGVALVIIILTGTLSGLRGIR